MKKLIILLVFIGLNLAATAQLKLSCRIGYGEYQMKSVAEYQKYILSSSGLPAKIVEQFPGTITYRFYIGKDLPESIAGFYLGYVTTGGRISISDYSGKMNFDMILNGYQCGVHIDVSGKQREKIEFHPYLDAGFTSTSLNLKQYLEIGEETTSDSFKVYANEANFQFGAMFNYLFPHIKIGAYAGYEVSVASTFHDKDNRNAKLGFNENHLTKPQWAGYRVGIELTYRFKKKG